MMVQVFADGTGFAGAISPFENSLWSFICGGVPDDWRLLPNHVPAISTVILDKDLADL
jgi:hypothetical protein